MRVFLAGLVLISSATWGYYPSPGLMKMLEEGMTMPRVEQILGAPDEVISKQCGASTPHPWQCRAWNFISADHKALFAVLFEKSNGEWVVNSWSIYGG